MLKVWRHASRNATYKSSRTKKSPPPFSLINHHQDFTEISNTNILAVVRARYRYRRLMLLWAPKSHCDSIAGYMHSMFGLTTLYWKLCSSYWSISLRISNSRVHWRPLLQTSYLQFDFVAVRPYQISQRRNHRITRYVPHFASLSSCYAYGLVTT